MTWEDLANFGITLILWIAITLLVYLLLFRWLRVLVGRTSFDADNIVLSTIRVPAIVAVAAYGLVQALDQWQFAASVTHFIRDAYIVILIAAISYLGWRIVKEVVLRWLSRRANETDSRIDDLVVPLIGTVGPLIFFLVALTSILQYLGIDVGLLAASLGIVGLVIGLAFQDSLTNLFSGIYLMIDPSFVENDLVEVGGNVYTVEKVGLRMTRMYDMETHTLIFVPNKQLTGEQIANITRPTIDLKIKMSVSMPSSTDPVRAITILHDVISSHRNVLGIPEVKLEALRKRIDDLIQRDPAIVQGERAPTLTAAFSALESWLAGDAGTEEDHARLVDVRREMNDRLTDAQTALRKLPRGRLAGDDLERLHQALGGHSNSVEEISENRIERLNKAFDAVKQRYAGPELAPLAAAITRLNELDAVEDELEATVNGLEKAREAELDRLMAALVWAGDWLAEEMIAHGHRDEAARISLWVRTMAGLYSEIEAIESVDGLDRELAKLADWLREMEQGGLTNAERARIRTLFGSWGGLKQMEVRRINELRRRVTRWMDWKEKDTLSRIEYENLLLQWERKLRLLSKKIPDTGIRDEDALDTELVATRKWAQSVQFMERLPEWKLPSITVRSFDSSSMEYTLIFNVDDIKQQHFERAAYVKSGILLDLFEACKREGIEGPSAKVA